LALFEWFWWFHLDNSQNHLKTAKRLLPIHVQTEFWKTKDKVSKMSKKIEEIPREKLVSDLLEDDIKPTDYDFVAKLHMRLCQEFGIDDIESPFSDQLKKKCENFAYEAVKLWRKRGGRQGAIFSNNRGMYNKEVLGNLIL
jgi:hypothetical protein